METISRRLKRLRDQKGLTMKEVASYLGISVSTYRDWEYGKSIQGEPYVKIAELFNISVSELLTGKAPQLNALVENLIRIKTDLINVIGQVQESIMTDVNKARLPSVNTYDEN